MAQPVTAITMRPAIPASLVLLALLLCLPMSPARAFSDDALIDGFMRTVFGSEFQAWNWQAKMVKKYDGPVRVFIDDRSSTQRGGEVADFVRTLPGLISGLDIAVVPELGEANYHVFVLNRADYLSVVSREVYGRTKSSYAPGKCLVRVVASDVGIRRSDAVIVADEGDFLFNRCKVEEVLQGLGPLNDDATLSESVFNDQSKHNTFTSFDRHILNMLYHPLVRPGMTKEDVAKVLPAVLAEVNARLP